MRYLLLLPILIYSLTTSAQYRNYRPVMEVMGGAGMPVLLGDIGNFGTGPAFRAGYRYRFDNNLAASSSLVASYVSGSDANSKNELRGLSYRTLILEPTVQMEYVFFQEKRGYDRMGRLIAIPRIRPFLFAGTGAVYFNPEVEGEDLTDVTSDYSKLTWTITGGAGVIYSFRENWLFSAELGGRYVPVDYLDGFSSFFSKANDLYYVGTLNIIYRWKPRRYQRR